MGVNFLVGADADRITQTINLVIKEYDSLRGKFTGNPFGDGYASRKIVDVIRALK